MNDTRVPVVFLALQFFTVFVAIATLFGRVFYVRYHDILGLPMADVIENVLAYAVISPDTTIASFGIAATVTFGLYFQNFIKSAIDRLENKLLMAASILVNGIIFFLYSVFPSIEQIECFNLSQLPEGTYGLIFVFGFAQIQITIAILARWYHARSQSKSSKADEGVLSDEIEKETPQKPISVGETSASDTKTNNVALIFDIFFIAAASLILMFWFVIAMGERNAIHDYIYADDAQIRLSSQLIDVNSLQHLECGKENRICRIGVVSIRDNFIYIRPIEYKIDTKEPWSDDLVIYGIPLEDVRQIIYFP